MATSNLSFTAQVDAWTKATEQRMAAVFHQATQETVSIAQSLIPVDTGFARASIRGSTDSMPQIDGSSKGAVGQSYPYDGGEISLVIAGAELGQTIYIGWTANYVQYLELGHSKQAPSGFVRLAAEQWPQTVAATIADAKNAVASNG